MAGRSELFQRDKAHGSLPANRRPEPVLDSIKEPRLLWLSLRRVGIFHPEFLGTEIDAVTKTPLGFELSVTLGMQSVDQTGEGFVLCGMGLCRDADRFIP
jgi:hypothetical protein